MSIVEVTEYETTDGNLYRSRNNAEYHQKILYIKDEVEQLSGTWYYDYETADWGEIAELIIDDFPIIEKIVRKLIFYITIPSSIKEVILYKCSDGLKFRKREDAEDHVEFLNQQSPIIKLINSGNFSNYNKKILTDFINEYGAEVKKLLDK